MPRQRQPPEEQIESPGAHKLMALALCHGLIPLTGLPAYLTV